jgi:hypothetical protein
MAVRSGLIENTYYHEGDTEWDNGGVEEYYFNNLPSKYNEIYRELYSRLSAGEDEAEIYAEVSVDDFWIAYYSVLADHPELFWIGSSAQVQSNAVTGLVAGYTIESTVPENERPTTRAMLEEAADKCIRMTDETWSDYGRIKSVYEYLIDTVEYNADAPDNQCIQSALLNHQSVCAGYSKAFQYICHRMGYFCTYVTGKINTGGDHAWNIVRLNNGSDGYHIDVTWDISDGAPKYNYYGKNDAFFQGNRIWDKGCYYLCYKSTDIKAQAQTYIRMNKDELLRKGVSSKILDI